MREYHIPIFVPHEGCPHDCAFCNQRHITGQVWVPRGEDVTRMITQSLATFTAKEYHAEVGFFGGSFTAIREDLQEELLKAAYPFVQSGQIDSIRCSTRPDAITPPILERLKRYGVCCVELGVQSLDDEVLALSRRGHTAEAVYRAAALIEQAGLELGVQMMTGLPGSTPQKDRRTAQELTALHPVCARIYPTLVIADTALCRWYKEGRYAPQSVEEAVEDCAVLYQIFTAASVRVIRMGLMATDEICENGKSVVAGPCHSAFGELVKSRVMWEELKNRARRQDGERVIFVHPKELSIAIGQHKQNQKALENLWGEAVRFVSDEHAPRCFPS